MGKNKGGAQFTPYQGELICTLCNKLGNAYQCSFCENYRTCGECGVCNNDKCKAETKVKKPPVTKEKAAAPTPKAPVNVPGLSTKQEPKTKGPKVNTEDDAYLEKKIEQAKKEQAKKEQAKKEKIKLVPEAPQQAKKKQSKAEAETVGPNSPRPADEKKAATLKSVLAEVDVSAVSATAGNLAALKELLETHCQQADVGVARIGLAATTAALNEPLSEAPAALRKALEATAQAADLNSAKALFGGLAKEIADDFKKPEAQRGMGHARLLLAQVVARTHPAVVADAAVVAEKAHAGYKSQHTVIPAMWLLAQARDTDMAVSIDAWAQYFVGALLAKDTGDVLVRQYAAKYTELLAGCKVPRREAKDGVKLDLASLYLKAYATASSDDTYAGVLMATLNFVKGVFMQYALREQVVEVLQKIVAFFEARPRDDQQPYADALTELAGQLLARDGWLFAVWRDEAQAKVAGPTAVAKAVAYLTGSQHLLAALRARGYLQKLHRGELQRTVVSLAATGEQLIAKIGKPSEKKGDLSSKAAKATQFFHDFNQSLTPSKWPARLRWLFVVSLITALVLKINSHCTAYPCGPARVCGDYHPCLVVRQPAVSPYLDLAAAQAETLRVAALTQAQPIMPYVHQAQNLLHEHVVVPATPHVAKAYDATREYVEAEVVPAANKVWTQAKPHVDTAVAWAEVNVKPHAEVAYVHASNYAQKGWVWADANVVQPGSVYAAKGAEWAKSNVVPHVHSAVAVAAAKAAEASDHVSTHVYPQVVQTANQLWAQGQEAAAKAGDWVQTEAAHLRPKAQRLYDDASLSAAKYYGEARMHVQYVANEAQPWVEKNIVPQVQTAWKAASENAQAAAQWAQAKIADLQKAE